MRRIPSDSGPLRRLRTLAADGRVLVGLAGCALDPYRPIMAHLMITRRCNLSCGYCYEADRVSPPVPLELLQARIDHLARLRTVLVTLTGGEPLLHPDLELLVAYVRRREMIPVMNSNGYLLTADRIRALGRAGLYAMQVSVDNVHPTTTTQKSLEPLLPKLKLLAEVATFRVRINTVLGSSAPEEALEVARAAMRLGFDAKCSLVRDDRGAVVPVGPAARRVYDEICRLGRRAPEFLSEDFQRSLIEDGSNDWRCRSGARYFMVCDEGRVHLCESSHGDPGRPLEEYDREDIRREFHRPKSCAARCAVAYAHQASRLDSLRPQAGASIPVTKRCWMHAAGASVAEIPGACHASSSIQA